MPGTDRRSHESRAAVRILVGALGSAAMHLVAFVVLSTYGALPTIDGEFRIPTEIEFGVVEAEAVVEGGEPSSPPAPEPPPPPEETPAENASDELGADAGRPRRDAGIRDASIDDGGVADAAPTDASALDGGVDGEVDGATDGGAVLATADDAGRPRSAFARGTEGASRQVAGAQLTLRIDFARMRGTPIEASTRQFLASIRDFQAVLGGSGIDPVRDLEQFLMSSPDPTNRRKFVYVGRLSADAAFARERVAELAASRGRTAEWTTLNGYPAAPWHDADDVGRVLVLLDDRHFVLCRSADFGRVLGWLRDVAEHADRPMSDAAGLALGVADDEVVSVEGVNLLAYAQGDVRAYTPSSARVSIVSDGGRDYDLALRTTFESAEAAAAGSAYWDDLRIRAARHSMVQVLGFGRILEGLAFVPDDREVRASTGLSATQVTSVLGLVQMQLQQAYARWDRARGTPPPGPGDAPPPPE